MSRSRANSRSRDRSRSRSSSPCQCLHGVTGICTGKAAVRVSVVCDDPTCPSGTHVNLMCSDCAATMMRRGEPDALAVRGL